MSLRNRISSSSALFVFEAAARQLSFSEASREFNVTQPAVSRTIRQFEDQLGTKLFRRHPTGVELTQAGVLLYNAVRSGFQHVDAALDEIAATRGQSGTVTISVTSAFAIHWFMPRFDRYRAALPDIPLRFQLMHGEPLGELHGADLGIRYNQPEAPDLQSWPLLQETVIPVCSPGYLDKHGGFDDCTSLRGHTLGHLAGPLRVPWERYLAETGYPDATGSDSMQFSDYALMIQAAIKGQCVALGWRHVVANELLQNGLVPAASRHFRSGVSYHVVAPAGRHLRKPTELVRDWLISEMCQ